MANIEKPIFGRIAVKRHRQRKSLSEQRPGRRDLSRGERSVSNQ